nr:unnamed protein product [Callosobruchus analis]
MAAHSGDKYADIADALMSVTDDQAQFSDIGGDSDAEDGLVLQQPRFKIGQKIYVGLPMYLPRQPLITRTATVKVAIMALLPA